MSKSKLFQGLDIGRKDVNGMTDLAHDLESCVLIGKENIDEYFAGFFETLFDEDPSVEEAARARLVGRFNIEEYRYRQIDNVINYYVGYFATDEISRQDSVDDICDDMIANSMMKDIDRDFFLDFIGKIKQHVIEDWAIRIRETQTKHRTSPRLENIKTSIEFRAIFDSDSDFDKPIQSIEPACIGVVPVITFQLELENAHLDKVFFQVDIEQLRRVSSIIERTIKEFEASRKYLKVV